MHALNDIGNTAQGYSFAGQIPPPGCATSGARWPLPKKTCILTALLLLLAFCRVNTVLPVLQFLPFLRFYRFYRFYRLYGFYRFYVLYPFYRFLPIFTVFTVFTVLPRPLSQATFTFLPFYRFTLPLLDCVVFTVLPFYGFRLCALRILHFSFLHFYRFRRAAVPGPRIPSNNAEPALVAEIVGLGRHWQLQSAKRMLTESPSERLQGSLMGCSYQCSYVIRDLSAS